MNQSEENVYKFIERVGKNVTERCRLVQNPGEFSIHADKSRQYREEWEQANIPFLYAAFIYVMSYTNPYCGLVNRTQIAQWVIDFWNDNKLFRLIIKEEDAGKSFFTIYWRDGERKVISAGITETIDVAFTKAGYGNGALSAVDWYDHGDTNTHTYDKEKKVWTINTPSSVFEDVDTISPEHKEELLKGTL